MDLEETLEGFTFPEHTEERGAGKCHFTGDDDTTDLWRYKGKNPVGSVRFVGWVGNSVSLSICRIEPKQILIPISGLV